MSWASELAYVTSVMAALGAPAELDAREVTCMAQNIVHEAGRHEPRIGMAAIAHVMVNRRDSPKFPNSICRVLRDGVKAGGFPRVFGRCAFTWKCDTRPDHTPKGARFRDAITVSVDVIAGRIEDPTTGAVYYYNPSVVGERGPRWERNGHAVRIKTAEFPDGRIGTHRFLTLGKAPYWAR